MIRTTDSVIGEQHETTGQPSNDDGSIDAIPSRQQVSCNLKSIGFEREWIRTRSRLKVVEEMT